ncbi:MAG: hypothetical protein ACXU8S_17395 [Phenylobacterium sp.]
MLYAPRAIRHFSLANVEARAQRTGRAMARHATPVRARPDPAPAAPQRRTVVRLWLPMTPIFLLLAPFVFLFAPLIYVCTPPRYRTPPFATAWRLGAVLLSLGGTVVHVDTPEALVSLRIF